MRYWDGTRWTEHVSDGGVQAIDHPDAVLPTAETPVAPVDDMATAEEPAVEPSWEFAPLEEPPVAPAVDMSTGTEPPTRRRRWPWIVGIAAAFLLGLGIGAIATSNQDKVDQLEEQLATASKQRDVAQAKVHDREAQRRANVASVAAAKTANEAAVRKAAAAKQAADQKAAEKAAADAKAAAEIQANAARQAAAEAAKKDGFTGDGVRAVGAEINPGLWHTDGNVSNCYYAILNSTDTSDIEDNNNTPGPASVTLQAGKYFETSGCSPWRRIG